MDYDKKLAGYALNHKERKEYLGPHFRKHKTDREEDQYRNDYQRDCDRIIWSNAFRRLQNKTQVFAHDDDDHYRRRLTHSIEVAGIACSIARKLSLNEDATRAIALGHDIGHAPFGHAGEKALNEILRDNKKLGKYFPEGVRQPVPLRGFNHCAHAIEVVERIETLHGIDPGLDLCLDIRDGILKHIYHIKRNADDIKKEPFSALSEIVKCKEYQDYHECNYGSLEAQCVWFADKVTYLFGDLEDAIRAKIFRFDIMRQRKMLDKLMRMAQKMAEKAKLKFNISSTNIETQIVAAIKPLECDIVRAARKAKLDKVLSAKFKNHYEEKYPKTGMQELYDKSDEIQARYRDDDVRQFIFWRNKAISVMIADCVRATEQRIVDKSIKSVDDVLDDDERIVDVSDDLKKSWREGKDNFYKKAMEEILFRHRIILRHTYNAGHKIRRLFEIYDSDEGYELVPSDYKDTTTENYEAIIRDSGVTKNHDLKDIMKIITIRNYIAGMTDAFVNQKLKEYTGI